MNVGSEKYFFFKYTEPFIEKEDDPTNLSLKYLFHSIKLKKQVNFLVKYIKNKLLNLHVYTRQFYI
jgi:hypothetical protein